LIDCDLLILGVNGLLGNTLFKYFNELDNLKTYGFLRNKERLIKKCKYFNNTRIIEKNVIESDNLFLLLNEYKPKIVINCLGIVKQNPLSNDSQNSIKVNSLFPHILYKCCQKLNSRLIHFSTDCIFSGIKGSYRESDTSDANDIYGRSKYLGEIYGSNAITLRTSFIGNEIVTNRALVNWFLSQTGTIKGYKKAIYSGLTTLEIARVLNKYVIPNHSLEGLYHLSSFKIDKYTLLNLLKDIYSKKIDIEEDSDYVIDRSLNSDKFKLKTGYEPIEWIKAIEEMKEFGEV